ncbi:MAG: hypothetical protein AB8I08_37935 [Sandaracinaceae bacterium]
MRIAYVTVGSVMLLLAGCDSAPDGDAGLVLDGGGSDAGSSDAGNSDGGNSDGGNSDAGNSDAGNSDAGGDSDGGSDAGTDAGIVCAGCAIDGACFVDGDADPANPCQSCQPGVSTSEWSANDGAACDDGEYCNGADTCLAGVCTHAGTPCAAGEGCTEATEACTPYNVAFLANDRTSGRFGAANGIDIADARCAVQASVAGLSGTFVALLSTASRDAATRVSASRGWVRIDGEPIADAAADLFDGDLLSPLRLDANGADAGSVRVWSASGNDGQLTTLGGTGDCEGWTDESDALTARVGLSDSQSEWLDSGAVAPCDDSELSYYCVQTDHISPLRVDEFSETGRLIFVSTDGFDTSTGRAGADALCAADAAMFPGRTFRAVLATTSESALERFTADARPLVRPDGLRVVEDIATAGTENLFRAVTRRADGSPYAGRAVTGAANPTSVGSESETCSNWTNSTSGTTGRVGFASGTARANPSSRQWFGEAVEGCERVSGQPVYCLED